MRTFTCTFVVFAALATLSSAQVAPDAGLDQTVAFGTAAELTGVLNNRSPVDFWTADGNFATENCILMYRDGQPLGVSPALHDAAGHVFGWPSDLQVIGGQVYGIESFRRSLYTVDVQSGLCTAIGPQNIWKNVYSLAYDQAGDRLFGVDLLKKNLLTFDRFTGAVTKVGTNTLKGYNLIRALAYRPSDGFLYAVDQGRAQLIKINPATGVPTFVRQFIKSSLYRVEELEFRDDQLYSSLGLLNAAGDLVAGQLQKIDLVTGAITDVGPILQDCSPHALVINSLPEDFAWSVDSGPGTVVFSDARSLMSSATFSAPGSYVLTLTAFASAGPVADTLTIDVQ